MKISSKLFGLGVLSLGFLSTSSFSVERDHPFSSGFVSTWVMQHKDIKVLSEKDIQENFKESWKSAVLQIEPFVKVGEKKPGTSALKKLAESMGVRYVSLTDITDLNLFLRTLEENRQQKIMERIAPTNVSPVLKDAPIKSAGNPKTNVTQQNTHKNVYGVKFTKPMTAPKPIAQPVEEEKSRSSKPLNVQRQPYQVPPLLQKSFDNGLPKELNLEISKDMKENPLYCALLHPPFRSLIYKYMKDGRINPEYITQLMKHQDEEREEYITKKALSFLDRMGAITFEDMAGRIRNHIKDDPRFDVMTVLEKKGSAGEGNDCFFYSTFGQDEVFAREVLKDGLKLFEGNSPEYQRIKILMERLEKAIWKNGLLQNEGVFDFSIFRAILLKKIINNQNILKQYIAGETGMSLWWGIEHEHVVEQLTKKIQVDISVVPAIAVLYGKPIFASQLAYNEKSKQKFMNQLPDQAYDKSPLYIMWTGGSGGMSGHYSKLKLKEECGSWLKAVVLDKLSN